MRLLIAGLCCLASTLGMAQDKPSATLPKVVLVGDSIRLSYAASVEKSLAGKATIISPKANGGDSSNVLRHLEAWVIEQQPAIVHFNCGIHDTKKFKAKGEFQVSPEQYETNLRSIVERVRAKTDAVVLFATTTPILDDRAAKTRSDRNYELLGASVEQYNAIARRVMRELRVPVNDLHAALAKNKQPVEALIGGDGVHLTETGRTLAGRQVAQFIGRYLEADARSVSPDGEAALPEGVEEEPERRVGPWKIADWKEKPAMTWLDRDSPIRSLTFRSEPHKGIETDVFAFYATPGSISGDESLDRNLPAVVLIHGGGGTAFAEWVWMWAKRGYAAIAMDLSGRRPEAPKFDTKSGELISNLRVKRTRLERGGPEADRVSKFDNVGGDVTDDWQYHAVAAVMRAHSLVGSFPQVNADRTAVTGISWGGYMTCLVASLDDRFQAAVPVYGCGFLYKGESVPKPLIDRLDAERRTKWIRTYDPSVWLRRCSVPILFVNGTNDKHYPLNSYMQSYGQVQGKKQLRIEAGMRHSHGAGWAPKEIALFIDQHVKAGVPLPRITDPDIDDETATSEVVSKTPLEEAEIVYTIDSGPLVDRNWQSDPATIAKDGKRITATIPLDATLWMLTVTDSRGAMVSTQHSVCLSGMISQRKPA